jgi:VWFA-related protein
MTSAFRTLVPILLAATIGASAQDPPRSFAPVPLVEIDAVVVDGKGNFVDDVRPEEIEVWIERHRIPLESLKIVRAGDEGNRRSVVLLLDDITMNPSGVVRARDAAKRFVTRLGPGDQMAIVTLNGDSTKSTDDRATLLRSIDAYNPRAAAAMRPDDLSAHFLNTLTAISRQVAEAGARRRTIVAIGPAWLFDTPIPPPSVGRDVRKEWTEAVRTMARNNVTLYVIDPGGVGASRVTSGTNGFARETGGMAFSNTNDVDRAAVRILRDAVAYYTVRVVDPPMFKTADLRMVDVRVLRRGLTVFAPRFLAGASQ